MLINQRVLGLLVCVGLTAIGCNKKNNEVRKANNSAAGNKSEAVQTSEFSSTASDGREFEYAKLDATRVANTDYTRMHPKTAEFYGVSSDTAIEFQHSITDVKKLRNFTNFQEAIFEDELILAVKTACDEEGYTSIRSCLNDGVGKSGALVLLPTQPRANPNDPNDVKHILDVADNTFGLISHLNSGFLPAAFTLCFRR